MTEQNKCPECDKPIENVRATCPNCGYEYAEDDYTDKEVGNELLAGSNIDDSGEEITDKGPGTETTRTEAEEKVRERISQD
jgi:hypothetical protein